MKLSNGGGELTFLDTPGHAAFSAMRQRGAKCTDVAVLVCAADDGVMPQTREAAAHIQAANCRYVVAITKCDAPGADPTRVRDELIAAGIPLEQSGGDVQCVDVSALSGSGHGGPRDGALPRGGGDEPSGAEGLRRRRRRLEARKDPSRGPVVTGLLRRGRLEVGACVVAGAQYGRVRRLVGYGGVDVDAIGPSEPFELAGLRGVPLAGDPIQRVGSEDRARRVARAREARATQARLDALAADAGLDAGTPRAFELEHTHAPVGARGKAAVAKMRRKSRLRGGVVDDSLSGDDDDDDLLDALDDDDDDASQNRDLCCIVKADVQGTAEAVRDAVLTLGSPAVGVKVVYVGVGPVTESDVSLAAAIGGPILAFNVREPPAGIAAHAKRLGVPLVERKVIYHLLDAVGEMLGDRAPERLVESVAGEAEVRAVFDLSGDGNKADVVAGCLVNVGALDGSERFRVMRDGAAAHEGLLECESIRRHKLEVTAVGKGTDCGVSLRWGGGGEGRGRAAVRQDGEEEGGGGARGDGGREGARRVTRENTQSIVATSGDWYAARGEKRPDEDTLIGASAGSLLSPDPSRSSDGALLLERRLLRPALRELVAPVVHARRVLVERVRALPLQLLEEVEHAPGHLGALLEARGRVLIVLLARQVGRAAIRAARLEVLVDAEEHAARVRAPFVAHLSLSLR